jgi:sugar lactone lactonase YvrE
VATRQNNGLEFDSQGRLVAAQEGRVARYRNDGVLDSVLVQSGGGVSFGQVNDLSLGSNGTFYFTDLASNVFYANASRQVSIAASGLSSANGIEWLEEGNAVFVNEAGGGRIRRFMVQPNGSLSNPTTFAQMPVPDGGAVDAHGNRYVASYAQGEIRVFNAAGDSLGFIRLRMATGSYDFRAGISGNTSNCAFGGPGNTTLYITGDGGLYSIQLRIPGRTRPGTSVRRIRPLRGLRPANPEVDALGRVRFFFQNIRISDTDSKPILRSR